jgi:hypothetical protein
MSWAEILDRLMHFSTVLKTGPKTRKVFARDSMAKGTPEGLQFQIPDVPQQGSFFRLQNTEGLTVVGLFMEGTTLTCLETYSDAKKRTLSPLALMDSLHPSTLDGTMLNMQHGLMHWFTHNPTISAFAIIS